MLQKTKIDSRTHKKTTPTTITFKKTGEYKMWILQNITVDKYQYVKAKMQCMYCGELRKVIPDLVETSHCKDSCLKQSENYSKENRISIETMIPNRNPWQDKDREWQDTFQNHPDY